MDEHLQFLSSPHLLVHFRLDIDSRDLKERMQLKVSNSRKVESGNKPSVENDLLTQEKKKKPKSPENKKNKSNTTKGYFDIIKNKV